ncbi:RsmE family RNA methyltransferase [Candidatus Latescibacterota bacterium]
MQNFLTSPELFGDITVELTGGEYHHATRACRVRIGEEIGVTDGRGRRVVARIEHIDKHLLRAAIVRDVSGEGEPLLELTVALAVIRATRFEAAVEKCTELGVRRFVPVIMERCEPQGSCHLNRDRLMRIASESAKQAARSFVPEIGEPCTLPSFLDTLRVPVFAASQTGRESIEEALARHSGCPAAVCLIGPEGDFTEHERSLIEEKGVVFVSLGGLTLRSETAAIVAVSRLIASGVSG